MGSIQRVIDQIESSKFIDEVSDFLSGIVTPVMHKPAFSDVLTGRWLGHNAHPMVAVAPLGFWIGAGVLDVSGMPRASKRLIGAGMLFALPAVVTGLAEWVDIHGAERNLGTTHAITNEIAFGLYTASWFARRSDKKFAGIALSTLGLVTVGSGGYLGGHLAYVRGVGINTTAFQSGPDQWHRLMRLDELDDHEPVQQQIGGLSFLAVRDHDRVMVLEDRCTHRGAPLSDGELVGGCIECPWHGSRFDLRTGEIVRGPATTPQPAYETRVKDGFVEVKREEPGELRRGPVDALADPDD